MTIGVNRGSAIEKELIDREKDLGLTVLRFDDDATTIQALFSGQVQAVASPEAQSNAAISARQNNTVEGKFFFSMQPSSFISVSELSGSAAIIEQRTFRSFETYIVVTIAYLVLALSLKLVLMWLGDRLFTKRVQPATPGRSIA